MRALDRAGYLKVAEGADEAWRAAAMIRCRGADGDLVGRGAQPVRFSAATIWTSVDLIPRKACRRGRFRSRNRPGGGGFGGQSSDEAAAPIDGKSGGELESDPRRGCLSKLRSCRLGKLRRSSRPSRRLTDQAPLGDDAGEGADCRGGLSTADAEGQADEMEDAR